MKRLLAIVLCACFALSFAACSGGGSENNGKGKTVISQIDNSEAKELKAAKAVTHGRVSGNSAPEGWEIKSGDSSDSITYIQKTEADEENCPYVEIGCNILSADEVFNSVATLKDTQGVYYTTDDVELNGSQFLGIFCEDGTNSVFGTVNGQTMVINYKGVELDDETVQSIIGGIEIAAE